MPASKASNPAVAPAPALSWAADAVPAFAEHHYTVDEIAQCWTLSRDKVQRIFQGEPGVIVLEGQGARFGKRRHRTLRIPASVAERVHRRLSVVKVERLHLTARNK